MPEDDDLPSLMGYGPAPANPAPDLRGIDTNYGEGVRSPAPDRRTPPRPRMRRPGADPAGRPTADQLNQRELDRLSRDGGAAYGAGFGLEKKKAALGMKKGGPAKMKSGGAVKRDGIASRGKTKGRYI